MNKRAFFVTILGLLVGLFALDGIAGSRHWFKHKKSLRGSGELVTEQRETEPFTALKLSGSFDVYVTIGEPQSVRITLDDNIMEFAKTEVRNERLEIWVDTSYSTRSQTRVDIVVPNLEAVFSYGSGNTEVNGIRGDLFRYEISGSGDLTIDGEVDDLRIAVSGSGDVDARDLKARDVSVRISGSGDVTVYASESIEGRVSGSGDIAYYGNPEHVGRRVSGSGSIRRKR